jgi:hypothetical protein
MRTGRSGEVGTVQPDIGLFGIRDKNLGHFLSLKK